MRAKSRSTGSADRLADHVAREEPTDRTYQAIDD